MEFALDTQDYEGSVCPHHGLLGRDVRFGSQVPNFGMTCCLHLQVSRIRRHRAPAEYRYPSTGLAHNVITTNTRI